MPFLLRLWLLCSITFLPAALLATALQPIPSTDSLRSPKRLRQVAFVGLGGYTVGMFALYQVWYRQNPSQPFQFFNDNDQWKQMDKVGHAYSAYQLNERSSEALRWAGLSAAQARKWGALSSWVMISSIEIFDGFSAAYGASWGDLLANSAGTALWVGQDALWGEQRLLPKFSFRPSPYSALRPNTLGSTWTEQLLKDYNAQTYWLSVDIHRFLPVQNRFPHWLNIAVGYSANEMIFSRDSENQAAGYQAYRQYFIGIDFDLRHIPTKRRWLKQVFKSLGTLRLPAPSIEYNGRKGWRWHWLYF